MKLSKGLADSTFDDGCIADVHTYICKHMQQDKVHKQGSRLHVEACIYISNSTFTLTTGHAQTLSMEHNFRFKIDFEFEVIHTRDMLQTHTWNRVCGSKPTPCLFNTSNRTYSNLKHGTRLALHMLMHLPQQQDILKPQAWSPHTDTVATSAGGSFKHSTGKPQHITLAI